MYVEEYLKEGIRIDTLVPQNEPGYSANGYPTMTLESWQEAELASEIPICIDLGDNILYYGSSTDIQHTTYPR